MCLIKYRLYQVVRHIKGESITILNMLFIFFITILTFSNKINKTTMELMGQTFLKLTFGSSENTYIMKSVTLVEHLGELGLDK